MRHGGPAIDPGDDDGVALFAGIEFAELRGGGHALPRFEVGHLTAVALFAEMRNGRRQVVASAGNGEQLMM
jgi:hypothetical protein